MITRDLAQDIAHSHPWAEMAALRQALQHSNLLWHFLELPAGPGEERRFVATGHIVCFDCDLCEEQGDVRFTDAMPAPWRESYGDCTDAQDEDDAAVVEEACDRPQT